MILPAERTINGVSASLDPIQAGEADIKACRPRLIEFDELREDARACEKSRRVVFASGPQRSPCVNHGLEPHLSLSLVDIYASRCSAEKGVINHSHRARVGRASFASPVCVPCESFKLELSRCEGRHIPDCTGSDCRSDTTPTPPVCIQH